VLWNDRDPAIGVMQDRVASRCSYVHEPHRLQGLDDLDDLDDLAGWKVRQRRAHAAPGSSNEVTSGVLVTASVGSSISSRYSATASRRLPSASSIVPPWLAGDVDRQALGDV
jgi:hypothetical protein